MKSKFSTIDVIAVVHDLRQLIGMRVISVYDVDSKTYMFKLSKTDIKVMLMFESGVRIHTTEFGWSKNILPSSFSMKMRKHLKQKRLDAVSQVGNDRIVDLQFASGEYAHHVIVELYDRGNVVLTDHEYVILNILRPRTDKETDVRYAVRQCYFADGHKPTAEPVATEVNAEAMQRLLTEAQPKETLQKLLTPMFPYGAALLEHCCLMEGLQLKWTAKRTLDHGVASLVNAMERANALYAELVHNPCQGYIAYRLERNSAGESVEIYTDFHPYQFAQMDKEKTKEFPSFNAAVDEFFSKLESQRLDQKQLQQEKAAMKKLDNIRKDHDERLSKLQEAQKLSQRKATAVELNHEMVDRAIMIIRDAVANQFEWNEIEDMIEEAAALGDPVASRIVKLDLSKNQFIMRLNTEGLTECVHEEEEDGEEEDSLNEVDVEIDIGMNAFRNARRMFDQKKQSALKEAKTVEASEKALRSAQAKTQQQLKNVRAKTNVGKVRKTFWFEKFYWFISSDRLLVIGGRDAQQNELIVKRYLKPGDVYVHADIRGATSVLVKREGVDPSMTRQGIPPKTLTEAASMAVCFSAAWEAKVVANAWWVHHDQVSKTAPAGEYLTTGSFMIRGKKNYIAPSQLLLGFGVMFRLDEDSARRYLERLKLEKQEMSAADNDVQEVADVTIKEEVVEVVDDGKGFEFPDVRIELNSVNLGYGANEADAASILPPMVSKKAVKNVQKTPAAQKRKEKKKLKNAKSAQGKPSANPPEDVKEAVLEAKQIHADKEEDTRPPQEPVAGSKEAPAGDAGMDEMDDEPEEESAVAEETLNAIQCLAGTVAEDDVMLYAVPVCAPYSAMSSFTFKVKLTPGTTKKSSAVKTAINLFLNDKTATAMAKDLIKVMKEQDLSRNIPGKVKVSAPHLAAAKKR